MATWADEFNTYDDACRAYGIDTPAQLDAEMEIMAEEMREYMAEMEAAFGPWVCTATSYLEECPF